MRAGCLALWRWGSQWSAAIQTFLVFAVDLALQGSSNFFAQHPGNALRHVGGSDAA